MMKLMIFSCLVAAAFAAAVGPNEPIAIVSQENVLNPDGTFHSSYESADGTRVQQEGHLLPAEAKDESDTVGHSGRYSFVYDGVTYEVTYTADKEGFKPEGAHLPVPPPIPEAIQRSLDYNAAHPEEDDRKN